MSDTIPESLVVQPPFAFEPETPVTTAVDEIKDAPLNTNVYYAYVVDGERLAGVASMRELLNASPEEPLSAVMTDDIDTVSPSATESDIVDAFTAYRYPVLPVTDDDGRLEGVIRAADTIEVFESESTDDIRELFQDVQYDPTEEGEYECFECGTVITAESPGQCPNCGGEMRNRRTTIE